MRKLILITVTIFLLAFSANAGSNGELKLEQNKQAEIKDCFEKLNRATFSFNQSLDKTIIKIEKKTYLNVI